MDIKKGVSVGSKETTIKHDQEQYVTFTIGAEVYGVEVQNVHQIVGMVKITQIPNTLVFMKGMINLRGTVIPVVDMRLRFGMEERTYDQFSVILIVEIKEQYIGMIVDSVADVLFIPVSSIQETPHFSSKINTDYIKSIGNVSDQLVIILDVTKILSAAELEIISKHERNFSSRK